MSVRASSRSRCSGRSSASPRFTAAALIRCRAAVETISSAGTSAMSRDCVMATPWHTRLTALGIAPVRRCAPEGCDLAILCTDRFARDSRGSDKRSHRLPPASTATGRRVPVAGFSGPRTTSWASSRGAPRGGMASWSASACPESGGFFVSRGRPRQAHLPQEDTSALSLRINERIRVPEVRLVGPNGETVGIVRIEDALRLAQEADLDLVEVAPTGRPPVCKLMDYGKFKYENAQKAREARRNQTNVIIKEMKLRPKIDDARLRDQEGSRRAVPPGRRQGQDHDHVPRS